MRESAGLLLYRHGPDGPELLLAHPGGPLWSRKDDGAWSIPKGEPGPDETDDLYSVACREFTEETGQAPPRGQPIPLGELRQKSGKVVVAWALEGDLDPTTIESNTFEMEWPPRSGRRQSFPEIDRVAWFRPDDARRKLNPAQVPFVDRLLERLATPA